MIENINDFMIMCAKFFAAGGGFAFVVFAVGTAADIFKGMVLGFVSKTDD